MKKFMIKNKYYFRFSVSGNVLTDFFIFFKAY